MQVKVKEGILEGKVEQNPLGGQFCSFRGIPYAEPPIGNLRFKAPVPKKPWNGVRSAVEHGSVCYQPDMLNSTPIGSEDCLFLNVYTPDLKPKNALPVMVFIHGGAFKCGDGNDNSYGPDFLVRHGVILVTLNYRTEVLGFLCLDTEEIPGNAGMKDQVAALRWVKNNIKNFGGDPENVTIFGESAGGASVSYHLVSPMSKGLFKKAIPQSGALTCWWTQIYEPREKALKLAKQLGCNSEDDKELAEFFRNVPLENLINIDVPVTYSTKLYELSFAVVNEKKFGDNDRFFYGDQIDMLKNGFHEGVKVMTGYTQDEGTTAFLLGIPFETFVSHANGFKEFFVPKKIQLNCTIKDQLEIGRKVKEFYFKKDIASKDNFDQIMTFLNWDMYLHEKLLSAKIISKQTDVYLYKFTCKSERNVIVQLTGLTELIGDKQLVCHGDDLSYLFSEKKAVDQNSESFTYINRMTTLWTNFAKFGDPTPDNRFGVKWTPYTVDKKSYLDIGNTLVARTNPDAEDEAFWDAIYKQYLPTHTV